MVGAGALGCELIKAYALMGIGCSKEGKVVCTDNDNIEMNNNSLVLTKFLKYDQLKLKNE